MNNNNSLIRQLVVVENDELFTTSLIVAEKFGKQHKNVLQSIDNLLKIEDVAEFNRLNFQPVTYTDAKGETRPMYRMTEDGFALLVMGFTGEQAIVWKTRFIEAFRMMRDTLTPRHAIPLTFSEALRLAADAEDRRLALAAKVDELTPKAEFHDAVSEAIDCINIRDFAKVLNTGQNRMFKWLRNQKILMHDNTPYQRFVDAGYFRVVEGTYRNKNGESLTYPRTLVTGKGQPWLVAKFNEHEAA